MIFSAPTFLFVFLPAVLLLASIAPRFWRNFVLLAASLLFYAWGEAEFVLVMLASIAFNYVAGLFLGPERSPSVRRGALRSRRENSRESRARRARERQGRCSWPRLTEAKRVAGGSQPLGAILIELCL